MSYTLILTHRSAKPPTKYGMIVFTGFQALGKSNIWPFGGIIASNISSLTTDVFGPLSTLNVLSRTHEMELAILAESMTPVSTNPEPNTFVSSSFGQEIVPTHTFENAPEIEVLLIPGG